MKNDLKNLFTGYWNYLAVKTACELLLFDKIAGENHTAASLCAANGWDEGALNALLGVCAAEGLLENDTALKLTPKGELLQSTHPAGWYYACLHWAGEHLDAWKELAFTIRTGKPAFEKIYGAPYFEYLAKHTERLHHYHLAMQAYALDDYEHIATAIDFSASQAVLDVGGGYGALIRNVKKALPELRCALFDLPEVVSRAKVTGIEKIPGNFFEQLPTGFDTIVLSRVIHDWNDEKAIAILRNVYAALQPGGRIILVENLTDRMHDHAAALTLNMYALCAGYERAEIAYRHLLQQAGFVYIERKPLTAIQYVLTALKQ